MTTPQLLILSAIVSLYFWSITYRLCKDDDKFRNNFVFEVILFSVMTLIASVTVVENNKIAKGCPQLEKLENVYKIK